jgi:hypothetical protein
MRCQKCRHKYSLVCGLGPGGSASPGQYSSIAAFLSLLGLVLWFFDLAILTVIAWILAFLVFLGAVCISGYREPATAYHGSICPKCGHKNRIWPWNF